MLILALVASLVTAGCGSKPQTGAAAGADPSMRRVGNAGVLRWGADVVGGVPYAYDDPKHPGTYIGFEVDIANEIARRLGVKLAFEIKAWDSLIPELQRGSIDMAMNGIEDTPERAKMVLFSDPYYVYSQQITVRKGTDGVASLEDLKGKTVGTLSGTAAEDILRAQVGIQVVPSPEITYSYQNLERGRVDAVVLDTPIAVAYGATNPKLQNVGESFQEGHYVMAFRKEDRSLRDAVNDQLVAMKQDGTLRAIYSKWGLLDSHQASIGLQ